MITRSAVAKILGRSLTTVRRMEGETLFPIIDDAGVHWFEEDEVELIKADIQRTGRSIRAGLAAEAIGDAKRSRQELVENLEEAERTVASLRHQLVLTHHKLASSGKMKVPMNPLVRELREDVEHLIRQLPRPSFQTELLITRIQVALSSF